ncbi:hypothetical protein Pelo_18943 [Pelomyxa schiedti]|nr:hypothetical protein Pelo_18943 [Pelomyxa schiedti]
MNQNEDWHTMISRFRRVYLEAAGTASEFGLVQNFKRLLPDDWLKTIERGVPRRGHMRGRGGEVVRGAVRGGFYQRGSRQTFSWGPMQGRDESKKALQEEKEECERQRSRERHFFQEQITKCEARIAQLDKDNAALLSKQDLEIAQLKKDHATEIQVLKQENALKITQLNDEHKIAVQLYQQQLQVFSQTNSSLTQNFSSIVSLIKTPLHS